MRLMPRHRKGERSERSLTALLRDPDARAERLLGTQAMAILFIAGGALGYLTVAVPHASHRYDTANLVIATAALIIGLAARRWPHNLTSLIAQGTMLALGGLMVTSSILFSPTESSASAFFFLWVTLLAFYFLPPAHAMVQLALMAVSYGVALWWVQPAFDAVEQWILTVATLASVGPLVSVVKTRVRSLIQTLAEAAQRDPLTGLLNRRGFAEELDAVLDQATATYPVGLIKVDLDYFKEVNENFGQAAGDELLQTVARLFERAVDEKGMGFTSRMGGEDFAITLPSMGAAEGLAFANELRDLANDFFAEEEIQITMSFGVSAAPGDGRDRDDLVRSSDAALFAAKEFGRNRAVQFSDNLRSVMPRIALRRAAQREVHIATLVTLAEVLDLRDESTSNHSRTVGEYAEMMAREMGLQEKLVERIRIAGMLHDIGKIGIPDSILLKPSKLSDDEWVRMKSHPEIGARILAAMELTDIREWVLYHHERPDGRGYPRGLKGDEIPIAARILSVADSYEAMTAERVYKAAMTHEAAAAELERCKDQQFDPDVVDAFLRALEHADAGTSRPRVIEAAEAAHEDDEHLDAAA